uniref:Ribonuclease H-like domain-containing protein n=1 Tax=Tanacetum cinerariifolium TaxID=118510 RepID=A0A6L2JZQ9_TANCI|nr:ribonuclease H-like domain-containing protein [Tanacetum cinerariifolium]
MASDDDNSNKNDDKSIGSSSELNLSFGDSLYLHPNDTGGSPIVTIKLTGTENYKMWSIAMTFALRNHNKLAPSGVTKDEGNDGVKIIMVNVIPPNHVDDVSVVEPNQHDDVPVVPDPVLVDEDEDPEEEEFVEEEERQEEDDDMEVDIEEDDNKLELTYPYKEEDPLNPSLLASESEPEDVIEVEDTVESKDETIPASVHEITAHALVEKKGKAKDDYCGKLILDLGNKVRSNVEEETAAMENLVRKLSNAEEKAECKKLKKELKEARFNNTFFRMQNERVERDIYWTRVRVHEFYQEMIRRGFVFEERPNEAIDVSVEDEKSPSSDPRESPRDS